MGINGVIRDIEELPGLRWMDHISLLFIFLFIFYGKEQNTGICQKRKAVGGNYRNIAFFYAIPDPPRKTDQHNDKHALRYAFRFLFLNDLY